MIRYGDLIFPDAYARPQFTPAEEAAQDAQERAQEHMEDALWDLEPDWNDAYPDEESN